MDEQKEVLSKLGEAWNLYLKIPKDKKHAFDDNDFLHAIHAAQNIMYTQLYVNNVGYVGPGGSETKDLIILNKGREKLYQKED